MLAAQKRQLTDQSELLAAQNQVIENDKAVLARQLEGSNRQISTFALQLAKKGNFLDGVKTDIEHIGTPGAEDADRERRLIRKVDRENIDENDWGQFREQFELVHPHFFTAILEQFPALNAHELRLMTLLKMNLDTKEISAIFGISAQSLNTARYRLRKHLGLATEEGLYEFVHRFGL